MRRLLTSILIVAVFAMQSVSFSHVHPPCGPEDAEHHSGRPHFHVHGKHSHHTHKTKPQHQHDEADLASTLFDAHHQDHDSDACYLPDSLASRAGLTNVGQLRFLRVFTLDNSANRLDHRVSVLQQRIRPLDACSGSIARGPLYLQCLAILC